MTPFEEVTGILAKAKAFCASIPEGDPRQEDVRVVNHLCETIRFTLGLRVTTGSSEATEAIGLLRLMLAKLGHYLTTMDAIDLGQKIKRLAAKRKTISDTANKAKIETAESRTRQVAGFWNHACEQHPDWKADAIAQEVAAKANLKQRALETHLARAREQGLIPERHRRT